MKVAVIGGGPAGMMAAITAAQNGAKVTLFEKNEKLGKKIYITGKGRCNLTNDCTPQEFLSNVATNKRFLYSAAYKWTAEDTQKFFVERGLKLKVERGNRVFPQSDKASDVTKILERALEDSGVEVCLNTAICDVKCSENRVLLSTITNIVVFDAVIIATGGASYPLTGSTGDGYKFAKSLGHSVSSAKAALCEIPLVESVYSLEGLSLKNVSLTARSMKSRKEISHQFGEMLFTEKGISGPIVLTTSSLVNKFEYSDVVLSIDLKPALDEETLDARVLRDFEQNKNKEFRNALGALLPMRLSDYVVARSDIAPNKKVNEITAAERKAFVHTLKNLTFRLDGSGDVSTGIVTCGGVDVKQIDPSTMRSKVAPRVYFAGEVVDVDAFTGGFNMQIAFSTGFLAGSAVSEVQK